MHSNGIFFVYVIKFIFIAVRTDFPLVVRYNHLHRMRRCVVEKVTRPRCVKSQNYQSIISGRRFILKIKLIESHSVISHSVFREWAEFVIMYIWWTGLSSRNNIFLIVQLYLMASEYQGFYKPKGSSKAFFPTTFGLNLWFRNSYYTWY